MSLPRRTRTKLKSKSMYDKGGDSVGNPISKGEYVSKEKPATRDIDYDGPSIKEKPPTVASPLLSESVDLMDHAVHNPITEAASANHGASFQVNSNPFAPSSQKVHFEDAAAEPKTKEAINLNLPPRVDDAPEQTFGPSAVPMGGTPVGENGVPVPDNVSRQAAGELADTILEMYKRLLPEVSHEFSKINVKEIKKLEQSGDLLAGAYDDVVSTNKDNKKSLDDRAKSDASMIKKPLEKLLAVQNIQAPPHIELIMVLIFVAITYFLLVRGIKKSNDHLFEKLVSKINANKKGTSVNQESGIPLVETEEVK